jgi:hypothetical protein
MSGFRLPDAEILDKNKILKTAVKDKLVLDFGCTGDNRAPANRTHKIMASSAKEIWGADIVDQNQAENFIEMDVGNPVHWYDGNIREKLDRPWDLITCIDFIEHLINPMDFLTRLKRFKCPIVCSMPNPYSPVFFLNAARGFDSQPPDHLHTFSPGTFTRLMNRIGYKITQYLFCYSPGHQVGSAIPWHAQCIMYILEAEGGDSDAGE